MVLVIVFPVIWESSNHSLNFASVTPVLSQQRLLGLWAELDADVTPDFTAKNICTDSIWFSGDVIYM